MNWNHKPWHSLDYELKHRFGTKVYKIALDGGMTCPNRDGSLGTRGCIFCSAGGSGDFAMPFSAPEAGSQAEGMKSRSLEVSIQNQIDAGAARIRHKLGSSPEVYIAYFQSYTNTYAPVSYLEKLFTAAIRHPQIRVLSIATRPDCLSDEIVHLLSGLNQIKPVWIELGLQTIHEDTAAFIRRGYPLSCFQDALTRLRAHGLETIVHVILGLPGESREKMLETIRYLAGQDIQGVKLQLLHILKGTDLADIYARCPFPLLSMEEYLDLVIDCIALLPPEIVIHRLTGDGPKALLIAPLWSASKRLVLGSLDKRFRERCITQGCGCLDRNA
ncbi:MAG: TIGR01212 family radical SAM protein [Lachnospiraceae bacterium]|nr:TIGR01212 family radical SAM protein [Lachnospiraceae bacterium]MCI8958070.1 TIGR01212 family radical SAM protein [Lachnospiraceae bacterium]